jgi:hypothetical protein
LGLLVEAIEDPFHLLDASFAPIEGDGHVAECVVNSVEGVRLGDFFDIVIGDELGGHGLMAVCSKP